MLNSLNQAGLFEQFFTIGLNMATLSSSNVLTLTINEGGDGSDGWAIDFLTIVITTQAVPEPASLVLTGLGALALVGSLRRSRDLIRSG